ncbi:hypothetical protein D3C78_1553620 [compost metagenome]
MAKSIVPSRSCDCALAIRLSNSSSFTLGIFLRKATTAAGNTVNISQGVIATFTCSCASPRRPAISLLACSSWFNTNRAWVNNVFP